MAFFKKKASAPEEPMDLDAVMKKYDRESNTRVWEGTPKIVVTCILAAFSLFCLYVTLFARWLEEWRLTSFVAGIVFLGYLVFPAKKGQQKVNHIPWYDIVLMVRHYWHRRFGGSLPPQCGSADFDRGRCICAVRTDLGLGQSLVVG